MTARNQEEVSRLFRRQSLHAQVVRACPHCGAPGYWHDVPGINPGCYDPERKFRAEADGLGVAPVGPVCPQCGGDREEAEQLGEIWNRVFRGPTLWEHIKQKWRDL
jgi:hypothetical protein